MEAKGLQWSLGFDLFHLPNITEVTVETNPTCQWRAQQIHPAASTSCIKVFAFQGTTKPWSSANDLSLDQKVACRLGDGSQGQRTCPLTQGFEIKGRLWRSWGKSSGTHSLALDFLKSSTPLMNTCGSNHLRSIAFASFSPQPHTGQLVSGLWERRAQSPMRSFSTSHHKSARPSSPSLTPPNGIYFWLFLHLFAIKANGQTYFRGPCETLELFPVCFMPNALIKWPKCSAFTFCSDPFRRTNLSFRTPASVGSFLPRLARLEATGRSVAIEWKNVGCESWHAKPLPPASQAGALSCQLDFLKINSS